MGLGNALGAALKAGAIGRSAHLRGKREAQEKYDELLMGLARLQIEREASGNRERRAVAAEQRAIESHDANMREHGYYRPAAAPPATEAPIGRSSINHSGVREEHVSDKPEFRDAVKRRVERLGATDPGGDVTLPTQRPVSPAQPIQAPAVGGWMFSADSTTSAKRQQAVIAERENEIRAWNQSAPPDKRVSDGDAKLIAQSPTAFAEWTKRTQGLDATSRMKEQHTFRVNNPLPSRARLGSRPNPTTEASRKERHFQQLARRAIEAAGGDPEKAAAAIVGHPETANVFSEGMSSDHLNAAAAEYARRNGPPTPARPTAPRQGTITGLARPAATQSEPSEQAKDWDKAAAALRARGETNPAAIIGPRPSR